jgi:Lines N-terminus
MCEGIIQLVDPQEADGGIKHAELFLHILFRMGLDHTTLLDMLISADTQFLKFFIQFLRYAEENMQDFKLACARAAVDLLRSEEDEDDQSDDDDEADTQMLEIVSEILEALYADLKMSEFPYNPKVLMIRIQNVIDKLSTDL